MLMSAWASFSVYCSIVKQYYISVRDIDDFHREVTFTFDKFNLDLLKHYRSIPYKYVIYSPKVVEEKDCYEYLHAHHRRHGDVNRCLQIPPEKCVQLYGGLYFYIFVGLYCYLFGNQNKNYAHAYTCNNGIGNGAKANLHSYINYYSLSVHMYS